MTITTMVWVQKNVHDVRNATKTVLCYLAQRAHYDDGTAAWPAMDTIASDCGITVKTVQRAIDALIEKGYLELGQQDFAGFDPRTGQPVRRDRRTVVWNVVCKDPGLPAEKTQEDRPQTADAVRRHAKQAATRKDKGRKTATDKMSPRTDETVQDKMSPREPAARVDKMSGNVDKMSPNNTRKNTFPSAPTGHLPASGAIRPTTNSPTTNSPTTNSPTTNSPTTPDPDPVPASSGITASALRPHADDPAPTVRDDWASDPDDPADMADAWAEEPSTPDRTDDPDRGAPWLLAQLDGIRADLGLTTRPATIRDRNAVERLAARLEATGRTDPWDAMLPVLEHALDNPFQAKRVDSGRRFARLYDELANDLTIDRRRRRALLRTDAATGPDSTGRSPEGVPAACAPHTHSAQCRHVDSLLDGPRLRAIEPSYERRHAYADLAATLLNDPTLTPDDAGRAIAARALDDRQELDRQLARLAAIRAANGGSMRGARTTKGYRRCD